MGVTIKLKQTEADARFKNNQTGTVIYSLEDFYKIYVFEKAFDEFMKWSGREYYILGQGRTKTYNSQKSGNANSNHLRALARDTYFKDVEWNKERFVKYAKKWKEIANKNGFIGEIGWYPKYAASANGTTYKGMIHIGGFITYGKTFYHWVTDGVQKGMPYRDEI